jgi:hypothetical protein
VATYAAAGALRAELNVDEEDLPDAEADRLIETAEDLVDGELALAVDSTTGRKVVQNDVEAWQWEKLNRATILVAAELYGNPDLARGRQWAAERGAGYAVSGPRGSDLGAQVLALLKATGWRKSARALTLESPYGGTAGDEQPELLLP